MGGTDVLAHNQAGQDWYHTLHGEVKIKTKHGRPGPQGGPPPSIYLKEKPLQIQTRSEVM